MEPVAQLEAVIPPLGELVRGVRSDQLDDPTPCSDFRVRDLLGHFIGQLDTVTDGIRTGEPVTELRPRPEILGEDLGATYDAVTSRFLSTIQEEGGLERTVTLPPPFGEIPVAFLARFVVFDIMMHSWDLATATGQVYSPPSDSFVTEVEGFARQVIAPEMRDGDTFAAETQAPVGASRLECLVAFSGRRL